MDDREGEHPDEGTIHAWLDGALDDEASRALAAHVASCRECAERVAEARGLIAGASRIVSALDDAPAAGAAPWGQGPAAGPASAAAPTGAAVRRGWRLPRVTAPRAAIAATVLVALGVALTYERTAVETPATRAATRAAAERLRVAASDATAPTSAPMAAPLSAPAPLRRDPLLDSAVKRNVAAAQPPRAVEAAPEPAAPVAPLPVMAPQGARVDSTASARVAVGRAAARAERDAAGVAPDQLAGRVGGVAASANERTAALAAECYRVESANDIAAAWGADSLPLLVRLDSAGRGAVLTAAGRPTGSLAMVTHAGDDSLLLRLRRIGFEGTLALGAPGDARAGVMRSRPLESGLSEVVTTAVPDPAAPTPQRRVPVAKSAPSTSMPAVPVVARRVRCPG